MGVAGCGKSSVGEALATQGYFTYIDGDDLHPEANIKKMAQGIALTDHDREPWLHLVGQKLCQTNGPVAIGCSALKYKYRQIIVNEADKTVPFIHLHAPQKIIYERMAKRSDHFMPTTLLDSQFADLEMLGAKEKGTVIDISVSFDQVLASVINYINSLN